MEYIYMTEEDQKISRSAWISLSILSLLGLVAMFSETMILPAIPDLIKDFSISYTTSSWILSSYLIAGAVSTPIVGKISDIFGKKKILLIILGVYSCGLVVAGISSNFSMMLVARISQGIIISIFPIAFGIIREILPEKKLAIGQTIFSSTFSGGAVIGLLVGANVIENYGWHATFFSVLPVSVFLIFIITRFIHVKPLDVVSNSENSKVRAKIDFKGAFVLSVCIVSFLVGISYLEQGIESSFEYVTLFSITIISLIFFVIIEKRTEFPIIDPKLMKNKKLVPATVILLIVGLCTFMVYQTIPILIRSPQPLGFGGNALVVAAVQLPFMIILLCGTLLSGFILNKVGNTRLTAIGTVISTIGFFSILFFHSSENEIMITLAIIAAGLSFAFVGGFNVVLLSVPLHSTGMALGMTLLLNLVGQSIGPSIAGMFQQMNQTSVEGVVGKFPSMDAYYLIFLSSMLISLTAVILALAINKRKITV